LQAFRMVYGPIQMKAMALGAAQFSQVNRSALLFLSSFLFLLAIYSIYISKLIFLFFIDEKFNFAQTIIFPLCMALFLSALNNIILGAISYVKKTIYMSISQLVSLFLFIVLVRPVIVNFGFQGAAYLLLFSTVLQCCVSYLFAQKLFRIDYNIWPVIVSVVSVFVFLSFYKVGLFYYLDVFLFFSCFMFFIYRSKFLTKIKKYI